MGYPNARVIVQDVSIDVPIFTIMPLPQSGAPLIETRLYNGMLHLLVRIGWKGKGYLTEELVPYGTLLNTARPLTPTWNFVRPYRMDPGEALTATIWPLATNIGAGAGSDCSEEVDSAIFGKCVGLMFHGVRIKDGNPIMLYDSTQELFCRTGNTDPVIQQAMVQKTLACPADSSILIHSVSGTNFDLQNMDPGAIPWGGSMMQIYGPGGIPWMKPIINVDFPNLAVAAPPGVTQQEVTTLTHWIDPKGSLIGLGEERGWLREPSESVTVEVEFPTGAASQLGVFGWGFEDAELDFPLLVTIRGSLEVSDA
jgi:hypothetical protein